MSDCISPIKQLQDNGILKTPHDRRVESGSKRNTEVSEKVKRGVRELITSELSCPGVTAGGAQDTAVNRDD